MAISTKGRYALQMMLDLALNDAGGYIALQDIAERQGIAVKYLEQIATALSREGLVDSVRGKSGGYRLSRKPYAYSLGEILRVMEGDLAPVRARDYPTEGSTAAALTAYWADFARAVDAFADGRTLEDLVDACIAMNGGDYSI